jgi:pimeloyl-ACP methyl ester carboxylesterase
VLAIALAASSCAHGPRLVDERATPPWRGLLASRDALPRRPITLDAPSPDGPGWTVAAEEIATGAGAGGPVIVLLNGVFSDARTWRFVVAPLAARADLLLVDLPGTGRSDPREPEGLAEATYTPRWLADRTLAALASWQARQPAPRRLVLVGHSVAGTAILRALGDPGLRARHAATLATVAGAALIAPADVAAPSWSPTLVELAKLGAFEIGFASVFGFLRPKVEGAIAAGVAHPDERALGAEADRVLEVLSDRPRRRASQAMLLRVRPTTPDGAPDWAAIRDVAADHGRVDVPVAFVWGRDDDTLPLAMGEKLAREVPGARLVVIDDARHSVHQERPIATSEAILRFAGEVGRLAGPGASPSARAAR